MTDKRAHPVIEVRNVSKSFGRVVALSDVSMCSCSSEVHCVLGENGAGKSTLVKIISGVFGPDEGQLLVDGSPVAFDSVRTARKFGIGTVYQDLALLPLMSVARNFFVGSEPPGRSGPFHRFDVGFANRVAREELARIGASSLDPRQAVGTLTAEERQLVAIARAIHHGTKALVLDEPATTLGVDEAAVVLESILRAKERGCAVILVTQNIHLAHLIGDSFTILKRGQLLGTLRKTDVAFEQLAALISGGTELEELRQRLEKLDSDVPLTPKLAAVGSNADRGNWEVLSPE
jgi:simple sugar transport system ATP-binding protein